MKRFVVRPFSGIVFFLFVASVFSILHFAVAADHPASQGVQIHTSIVDGYGLHYTLYDFPEQKTQHLMVNITGPDGKAVEEGKVGFLVTGPDGSKQKAMAMGMKGAYGANMDFSQKGVTALKQRRFSGTRSFLISTSMR